jgi:PAS domain S-box-containing protein
MDEKILESSMRIFFNMSPDLFCIISNEGRFIALNPAWESTLGYSTKDLTGKRFIEIVHPDDVEITLKQVELQLQGNETINFINRYRCSDNSYKILEWKGHTGSDGNIYAVARDVSDSKSSEEALRKSEQKFRQIFNNMQDVYLMTDIQGKILEISPSINKLLNYDREELIGTLVENLYFNREDRHNLLNEVRAKGELLDYELRLRHKNDQMVWASVNNHFVHDHEGNLLGFETIVRDINFRKLAEDEMRKLSTAVEHSPVSIVISDSEGKIVYANPKAVETTGYSPEELMGQNPRVLKSGETPPEEYRILWETISSGKQWSGTFHNKKKDGTLYWESSSISPIMDSTGKIINYVAVKEDITDKKKINDDLVASEAKLKEANATKDKLFSIIGHDLRSSIGSFEPILELLTDGNNLDESEKNVLLNALIQGSKTAYSLLENLLSWASGQSNRLNLEPVNFYINEIIDSNIELLSSSAYHKSITISPNIKERISVFADRNSIDLVVRNLISNAIKFTNEKGFIAIDVSDSENFVEIGISDNGVGIKKELAENLFSSNSFYTTLGTNFEKGSGLGLVLCKDFVEKNGGKIRVESEVGKGSRFAITIPNKNPNPEISLPG